MITNCILTILPEMVCGGIIDTNLTLTSPDFPRPYHGGQQCHWTMTAPTGLYFSISALYFDLAYLVQLVHIICVEKYLDVVSAFMQVKM